MGGKTQQQPPGNHHHNGQSLRYYSYPPDTAIKKVHAPNNRWNALYHGGWMQNVRGPPGLYPPNAIGYRSTYGVSQTPPFHSQQNGLTSTKGTLDSRFALSHSDSSGRETVYPGLDRQQMDACFYHSCAASSPSPNLMLAKDLWPPAFTPSLLVHGSDDGDKSFPRFMSPQHVQSSCGFNDPVQVESPSSSNSYRDPLKNENPYLENKEVLKVQSQNDISAFGTQSKTSIFPDSLNDFNKDFRKDHTKISPALLVQAISFSKAAFPNLGKKLYCVPPLDRFPHPDKASRLLVTRKEGEKRVLGSFKQYFSSKNMSPVMLCYYPINGFLFHRLEENLFEKWHRSRNTKKNSKPGFITLIIVSHLFPVTIVNVSVVNSNSDFVYLQNAVHKAVTHSKQCADVMSRWLNTMGVNTQVNEVLAFPNLKKSTMERLLACHRSYSKISTLLMNDLSPPFEEEWSTSIQKLHFTDWIERHVLKGKPGLSAQQFQLFLGLMCCPQISKFDSSFTEEINCVSQSRDREVTSQGIMEDVSQLKLTIDGVTKGFDEYIQDYVSTYYPNIETETYRVPPVHFNIQGQEKLEESIFFSDTSSLKCNKSKLSEFMDQPCESFMPPYKSYRYSITKDSMTGDGDTGAQDTLCNSQSDCSAFTDVPFEPQIQTDDITLHRSIEDDRSILCANAKARLGVAMEDVYKLSKVMAKDMRADEGESRVMNSFELIGKKHGPMFIICSYQYNNYLNKLREEMFSKSETARPVRAFGQKMRAQHDCLIFHKHYGAIIVCIKAIGDNFEEWAASEEDKINSIINIISKALKQLEREEAMVRHVTSDISGSIQCHKIIALPNLQRAEVSNSLRHSPELLKKINAISGDLGIDAILCQDELPSHFSFLWSTPKKSSMNKKLFLWWENICDRMLSKNVMNSLHYRQIVGRYCGLFSTVEVWTQTAPRVEVRSVSEAATECSNRFSKILLLPDQIDILLMDHSRLFLHGPPGSGKTLLLMLKAREWLCKGFKVIWLNIRMGFQGYPFAYGVERKLRIMLHKLKIPQSYLTRTDIDSSQSESKMLANILPSSRVIIDEVSPSSHRIIEHLCNLHLDRIWCASIREEHCPITATGFASFQLKEILRCPPNVQNLMKELEPHIFPKDSKIDETLMEDIQKLGMSAVSSHGHKITDSSAWQNKPIREPKFLHAVKEKVNSVSNGYYTFATAGPQPILIDHKGDGLPMECVQCGEILAKYLHALFHGADSTMSHSKDQSLRCETRGKSSSGKFPGSNYKIPRDLRKNVLHKNDGHGWSGGLIVAKQVEKNCALVKTLLECSVDVEVVTESAANNKLEDPSGNKLYFTMFHEATGLERRVLVFIPSRKAEQRGVEGVKDEELRDLRLQTYLSRFHEEDLRALWHMASRTLSTLILVLP